MNGPAVKALVEAFDAEMRAFETANGARSDSNRFVGKITYGTIRAASMEVEAGDARIELLRQALAIAVPYVPILTYKTEEESARIDRMNALIREAFAGEPLPHSPPPALDVDKDLDRGDWMSKMGEGYEENY